MADTQKKVVLITGASSGIGLDTAFRLLDAGYMVYGAARRTELLQPIIDKGGKGLFLDITDEASIENCVKEIITAEGRIDILINNAGYGQGGALEITSMEDARKQFDVNVFGLMSITKKILPYMRQQGSGRIVNVSSVAGKFSSACLGWYHASKYSVEALSDALRLETEPFGIKVAIIEPGPIKTNWGLIAAKTMKDCSRGTAYEHMSDNVAHYYESNYTAEKKLSGPAAVSKKIVKAATAKRPKLRYVAGKNAKAIIFATKILYNRSMDLLVKTFFGISK